MPRGNKTGPNGMGPMTGRAAGFCAGNDEAGFSTVPGGGFGRGRGHGGGFRRGSAYGRGRGAGPGARGEGGGCAPALPTGTEVKEAMNAEIEALERRISGLRREIDAIDAQSPSEDA